MIEVTLSGVQLRAPEANLAIGLGGTGTDLVERVKIYRSLAVGGRVPELSYTDQENLQHSTLLSAESSWIVWQMLSQIPAPDRVTRKSRRAMG